MWIGMYLGFILIALVGGWVFTTQILIPVITDRPLLPIFTVGRAQHVVAAAREHKLVESLHGEARRLDSQAEILVASLKKEIEALKELLYSDGDSDQWHPTCLATIQRIDDILEKFGTQTS